MKLVWLCLLLLLSLPVGADTPLRWADLLRQLERHPKIQAARLLPALAQAKVTEKEGAFDPQLFVEQEWLRYQSPTAPGKPKTANDNSVALQLQDLSGMKLTGGYRLNRNDVKSPDNLTGEGGEIFLELKLPLLRNLGTNEKRTALEQAKTAVRLAEAAQKLIQLDVTLNAGLAYWDWCAACTGLRLQEASWKLAEERAGQVEKRAQLGDLAPIEAVEARQEAVRRWEAVLKARRDVQKTGLKLGLYLWKDDFQAAEVPPPEQGALLLPPVVLPGSDYQVAAAPADPGAWQAEALEQRPELAQIPFERQLLALDQAQAENDRRPQLDLTLSPGLDMGNRSIGLTYKAGLQLTIPLATRGADGRLQAVQWKSQKLDLDQALEARRVLTEVRDAFSLTDMARQRYETALQAYQLALKLEQAERTKFQFGDSTLFLVNQRERATVAEGLKLLEILLELERGRVLAQAARGRFE